MNDYTFGNFLYELRTEKGLSQSQLGDMMGVSNKAVSKWEMGISKPRPAMLVMLASFFGVTVEELLAGRRNAETENQENEERDDTALKIWAGEYRNKKKCGKNAIITAGLLPFSFFVCAGIIIAVNLGDTALGPILMALMFLAEVIDIALIFVFYASARRLKRILYATYPDQAEELTAAIYPKKEQIPMLKWEAICVIAGGLCGIGCSLCRIIADSLNKESAQGAVYMLGLLFAVGGFILLCVAVVHYAIRCIRKKR